MSRGKILQITLNVAVSATLQPAHPSTLSQSAHLLPPDSPLFAFSLWTDQLADVTLAHQGQEEITHHLDSLDRFNLIAAVGRKPGTLNRNKEVLTAMVGNSCAGQAMGKHCRSINCYHEE